MVPGDGPRADEVRGEARRLAERIARAHSQLDDARADPGDRNDADPSPASVAGARLDDPATAEALRELLAPASERLGLLATIVDELAAGRIGEDAAVEGLRHLSAAQPVRRPR